MATDETRPVSGRTWQEVARRLARETDTQKIIDLSQLLNKLMLDKERKERREE